MERLARIDWFVGEGVPSAGRLGFRPIRRQRRVLGARYELALSSESAFALNAVSSLRNSGRTSTHPAATGEKRFSKSLRLKLQS